MAQPETRPDATRRPDLRTRLSTANPHNASDVGALFRQLWDEQWLVLPMPGSGQTAARFDALMEVAACDLSLARLVEGHVDALAIARELGHVPAHALYGVWAAEAVDRVLFAEPDGDSFRLSGYKPYASGARTLGHALVTARTPAGPRLFDVNVADVELRDGSWSAVGMASSDSLDAVFDYVRAVPVGGPNDYVRRAGFWKGSIGVAACWYGGAVGCIRMLQKRFSSVPPDAHAEAHFGAMIAGARAMASVIADAARAIDSSDGDFHQRALEVRQVVEVGCQDILARCGRASGSSPLVFDSAHARRAADLVVYLRQHHAERDQAALGKLALAGAWP